jgi:hypothetical protein
MIVTGPSRSSASFSHAICQPSDAVGDFVRISGSVVGQSYVVTKADPSNHLMMPAVGTVIQKITSTSCLIQKQGLCGFTGLPALDVGRLVFVGLDGKPTTTPPAAVDSISGTAVVQAVGVAAAADKVDLSIRPMFTKVRL